MSRPNKGPRLELNRRGIYEIRWTEAGRSKRSSTGTGDISSAQKVLGTFLLLDDRERAEVRAAGDGRPLVSAIMGEEGIAGADYWTEHVEVNVIDKDRVRYAFQRLRPHFGHLAVADITQTDVAAYVAQRRTGQLGKVAIDATIGRELRALNAAINHAVKAKRVPRADQPHIPLPSKSPPKDRWLTFDEADALLTAALSPPNHPREDKTLPRIYRFIALALNTASRKGAILNLRRGQVDMARGIIRLNPAGRAQTKKRRPPVPISDDLRPILERILREIPDEPDALLLGNDGAIRKAFEGAVIRAKLGYRDAAGNCVSDVTPHTLRHTKATWMAQAGVSMFDIAGVLGDTVETVTSIYAHHSPEHLRGAINAGRKAA